MNEKIIDEVMGLVKYACDSYAHLSWCKDNAEPTEAIKEELEQDLEAIRAKLREVLERKPMSNTEISLAAHNSDPGDWNNLVHKTCWLDGFHEGVKHAESHHGIGS